jgi:peptidoglycan/xylan/chitin deacetylase (PgdA/CDA1 family)
MMHLTMTFTTRRPVTLLLACALGLSSLAQAQEPAVSAVLEETAASAAESNHHLSAEHIRKHRLMHLEARLHTEPQVLHESCRYESEINTAPPARKVALTFDDGPMPGETDIILDTLKRYGIHATFFMIGQQARKHPELVERVRAEGHHVVANHSWDHPNFHTLDATAQALEVEKAEQAMAQDMEPKLFRYPYGNASCETNALLRSRGYRIVGWHVDSCDWAFDHTGSVDPKEATICGVLPQFHHDYAGHVLATIRAHHGGIVLMHEIHPNTIRSLDAIIQSVLNDGFTFGSVIDPDFATSLR